MASFLVGAKHLKRTDQRIIIHFPINNNKESLPNEEISEYEHYRISADSCCTYKQDYDCFYASVFEASNPALSSLPLAVQQKQIIVTCNYKARDRGVGKLQLIKDAKKTCPELVIVLGEDLTPFRDASKLLYSFLRDSIWSKKAERLGFDEVFLDVTDMVEYNVDCLNLNDLEHSFWYLDRNDPQVGFQYDASTVYGHTYPENASLPLDLENQALHLRLLVGSHLAAHLRHQLEEKKGYTATVGISSNKLLAKLAGNVKKPRNQTTLLPPYQTASGGLNSNVTTFVDSHDLGKIPGIGFKLAQKIRSHVLGRPVTFDEGLVYGPTKETVKVQDVRLFPGMGPELLGLILGGPGSPKNIGSKIWDLINGIDDTEVGKAKNVPSQISIEDSYTHLDTLEHVKKQLIVLAGSLIKRIRADLTEVEEDGQLEGTENGISKPITRWLAHPRTLRLSTRPRLPNPDGSHVRTFNRISRSCPMPNFIFDLSKNIDFISSKLVQDILLSQFRKLHPERSGWNLSLINIAATNMAEAAADSKDSEGRDIGKMFQRQEDVLKEWKVEDRDVPPDTYNDNEATLAKIESNIVDQSLPQARTTFPESNEITGSEDLVPFPASSSSPQANTWDSDDDEVGGKYICDICGASIPDFAIPAHERFHTMPD